MDIIVTILFEFIVNYLLLGTGEIIYFLFTLGGHRPNWELFKAKNRDFITLPSFWVGGAFWIAVIVLIAVLLR